MKYSIINSFLAVIFFLSSLVSFSCIPNQIVIKKEHNPELNNTSIISGYILDKDTQSELVGAIVSLNDGEYEARSDFKGFFIFKDLSSGTYKINIQYVGYKTVSKSDFRVNGNYVYDLNIELTVDLNLPPI